MRFVRDRPLHGWWGIVLSEGQVTCEYWSEKPSLGMERVISRCVQVHTANSHRLRKIWRR